MDYFNNVLATFLGLEHVSCIAETKLSDFINNILICVPKMNKGIAGLEQNEGE